MSQAGVLVPGGTPSIATNYVTDNGTAIPAGNTLNILGEQASVSVDAGIETVALPDLGDTVVIYLTNRVTGTTSTNNATPKELLDITLFGGAGSWVFYGNVVAYNTTSQLSYSTDIAIGVRTTGAITSLTGTQTSNTFAEGAMAACVVAVTVTGADNVVSITVTGLAGEDINWNGLLNFRVVG